MANYKKIYSDFRKYFLGTTEFYFLVSRKGFLYPIDLSFTLEDKSFYYSPCDKNGIPYKVYASVGQQYNPTRVAAYALSSYNLAVMTGDEAAKGTFLKAAGWFVENEKARYEYLFDWQDLKSPWISCMAQGEAASVLVRAYRVTGDEKYLEHANASLEPFFVPIADGGVQSVLPDGSLFVEEYPSKTPTHVLNGFMYALIGLEEYIQITGSLRHKELFSHLSRSLCQNIDIWCCGRWSLYEERRSAKGLNFCTPSYHNLQITQLRWLDEKIEAPELRKVVDSWTSGLNSLKTRLSAMAGKVYFRIKNRAQR